jgi:hypothetical protein
MMPTRRPVSSTTGRPLIAYWSISRAASGTEASERTVAAPTVMTSDAFMLQLLRSIALEDALAALEHLRRTFPNFGGRIGLTCWRHDYLIHVNIRGGDRD